MQATANHMLGGLVLAFLAVIVPCMGQAPANTTEATALAPANSSGSNPVLQDLEFLRANVLGFWARHGLDNEYGGIHGTLDRAGAAIAPTAKGLIQQARHVWAFSTHYLHNSNLSTAPAAATAGPNSNATQQQQQQQLNSTEQLAQSAYGFVVQHMQDANNSGLWVWNVSREGAPIQRNKVLTGQLSVLLAFSQYFAAFGTPDARDLAIRTFRTLDDAWHTPTFGGYIENPANGFPQSPQPPTNASTASEAGLESGNSTLQAGPGDSGEVLFVANSSTRPNTPGSEGLLNATEDQTRSLNLLMHGTDALAALYRATNDTVVGQRLLELLDIICSRLTRSQGGLLYSTYTPAPNKGRWLQAPGSDINYGTNLEIAWLVPDTLDYLLAINATSRRTHAQCTALALATGAAAVREAHDADNGGFYELRTAAGNVSTAKVWWVQSNAMLALFKLHKHLQRPGPVSAAPATVLGEVFAGGVSGRQPDYYLQLLAETVGFVRQYQTDNEVAGEQFWQVEPNGTFVPTGDADKDTKGNRWKASLYTTRAPLYLLQWLSADPQLSSRLGNISTSRPPRLAAGCRGGGGQCGTGVSGVNSVATSSVGATSHVAAGLLWKLFGILCCAAAMVLEL